MRMRTGPTSRLVSEKDCPFRQDTYAEVPRHTPFMMRQNYKLASVSHVRKRESSSRVTPALTTGVTPTVAPVTDNSAYFYPIYTPTGNRVQPITPCNHPHAPAGGQPAVAYVPSPLSPALFSSTCRYTGHSQGATTLLELQNLIKRDPESYRPEFVQVVSPSLSSPL